MWLLLLYLILVLLESLGWKGSNPSNPYCNSTLRLHRLLLREVQRLWDGFNERILSKRICWIVIVNKIALWGQNVLLTREPYVYFPASPPSASLLISLQKETFQQRTCGNWGKLSSQSPEPPVPTSEGTLLFTAAKARLKSSSFPRQFCLDVGCTPFQALWSPNVSL